MPRSVTAIFGLVYLASSCSGAENSATYDAKFAAQQRFPRIFRLVWQVIPTSGSSSTRPISNASTPRSSTSRS